MRLVANCFSRKRGKHIQLIDICGDDGMKQLLRDIAEIGAGQGAPQGDSNYCDDGTPFVKAGNLESLTTGAPIDSIQKVSDSVAKEHRLKLYPKGTVLFAKSGMSCLKGYVYVLPKDAYVVSHLACITPKEDVSEYLRYYFLYCKPNQLVKDAAYPSISLADIGNLEIDMNDNQARAHIITALSLVERVIQIRQKQMSALDDLIKARFVEMFGDPEHNSKSWPVQPLDSLCSVGSSKRIYQNEQSADGVPFWRISDLVSKMDTGVANSGLFIPEEKYLELRQAGLVPMAGDILVTSRGTLGRCYIAQEEDRFYFQDGMISWLSNYAESITPLYLQHLFTMNGLRKQIDGMQAGSTVAYLSIAMLKKLRIMVPSKEAQSEFSTFVAQIDKSKSVIQKSLDETQLLFDSLMQQYFG